jgi:hypothetical protein
MVSQKIAIGELSARPDLWRQDLYCLELDPRLPFRYNWNYSSVRENLFSPKLNVVIIPKTFVLLFLLLLKLKDHFHSNVLSGPLKRLF